MKFVEINEEKIIVEKFLTYKPTARYAAKYECHLERNIKDKYIVEYANTATANYYFDRARLGEKLFAETGFEGIRINMPIKIQTEEKNRYAIYSCLDTSKVKKWNADEVLRKYYSGKKVKCQINEASVEKTISCFLQAWPEYVREQIIDLHEFKKYIEEIKCFKEMDFVVEHGDFTINNILSDRDGNKYLADYEFVKEFQPIGFDLLDWHSATDKKYDNIPYLELNQQKQQLVNRINALLDEYTKPNVLYLDKSISSESDFVFNRYDLIYDDYKLCKIQMLDEHWCVPVHISGNRAEVGVWKLNMSQRAFHELILFLFRNEISVKKIDVKYSMVPFFDSLTLTNHLHIIFDHEDLLMKLKKKARYNFNRNERLLAETIGTLKVKEYTADTVPCELIDTYMCWKKKTHGTDYGLTASQLLERYHVTHIYELCGINKNETVAILLTCEQCEIVYLENLSYNVNFAKFSPGYILYVKTLQKLKDKGKTGVYLGNGNQQYKYHFDSVNEVAFMGTIYRQETYRYIGKRLSKLHKSLLELKRIRRKDI